MLENGAVKNRTFKSNLFDEIIELYKSNDAFFVDIIIKDTVH